MRAFFCGTFLVNTTVQPLVVKLECLLLGLVLVGMLASMGKIVAMLRAIGSSICICSGCAAPFWYQKALTNFGGKMYGYSYLCSILCQI